MQRNKRKEEGALRSRLLLSTATRDAKLCQGRVRLTGDAKVSSRERWGDSETMRIATWKDKGDIVLEE